MVPMNCENDLKEKEKKNPLLRISLNNPDKERKY